MPAFAAKCRDCELVLSKKDEVLGTDKLYCPRCGGLTSFNKKPHEAIYAVIPPDMQPAVAGNYEDSPGR